MPRIKKRAGAEKQAEILVTKRQMDRQGFPFDVNGGNFVLIRVSQAQQDQKAEVVGR